MASNNGNEVKKDRKLPHYVFISFKKKDGKVVAILGTFFKEHQIKYGSQRKYSVLDFNLDRLQTVDLDEALKLARDEEVYGLPANLKSFNPKDYILKKGTVRVVLNLLKLTGFLPYIIFTDYTGELYVLPYSAFLQACVYGKLSLVLSSIKLGNASNMIYTHQQTLSYNVLTKLHAMNTLYLESDFLLCYKSYISRILSTFEHFNLPLIYQMVEPSFVEDLSSDYKECLLGTNYLCDYFLTRLEATTAKIREEQEGKTLQPYTQKAEDFYKGELTTIGINLFPKIHRMSSGSSYTVPLEADKGPYILYSMLSSLGEATYEKYSVNSLPLRLKEHDGSNSNSRSLLSEIHFRYRTLFGDFVKETYESLPSTPKVKFNSTTNEIIVAFKVSGFLERKDMLCDLHFRFPENSGERGKMTVHNLYYPEHRIHSNYVYDKPTYDEVAQLAGVIDSFDVDNSRTVETRTLNKGGFVNQNIGGFMKGNPDSFKELLRTFGIQTKLSKGQKDIYYVPHKVCKLSHDIHLEIEESYESLYAKAIARAVVYQQGKPLQTVYIDGQGQTTERLDEALTCMSTLVQAEETKATYLIGKQSYFDTEVLYETVVEELEPNKVLLKSGTVVENYKAVYEDALHALFRYPYPTKCFTRLDTARHINLGIYLPLQLPVLYVTVDKVRWYGDDLYDTECLSTSIILCASENMQKLRKALNLFGLGSRHIVDWYSDIEHYQYMSEGEFVQSLHTGKTPEKNPDTIDYMIVRRYRGWDIDFTELFPTVDKESLLDHLIY